MVKILYNSKFTLTSKIAWNKQCRYKEGWLYFLERVAHRFNFPSVLLVLYIFVVLVSGWILASSFDWLPILLQGQDFGQITSIPNHCNFFLYRQTLFCNFTCLYIQYILYL